VACGAEGIRGPRPVRRTKAISDLAAGASPAGRSRSRSTCKGAGGRAPAQRCAQTAPMERPSDRHWAQFCHPRRGPGRISCNAHIAPGPDAENRCGRLAGLGGRSSSLGGCFDSPRAGDRARGAPGKARTAADPDRRWSAGQCRNRVAPGFEPTCRTAALTSRSNAANGSCAVAAFSAPRIGAAPQPPDGLRPIDRDLRHLSAYRVSAGRHASGSPFGPRRQD
jgi:hypothetical protein